MPEDIEKRVTAVERAQDRLANTLEQINAMLKRFEAHIDELFEVKTKIDSIDAVWKKVDGLSTSYTQMDKDLHILRSEHQQCMPLVTGISGCKTDFEFRIKSLEDTVKAAKGFAVGQFGNLMGYILPALLGAAAVYAVSKGLK